jgi:hypothetical protein
MELKLAIVVSLLVVAMMVFAPATVSTYGGGTCSDAGPITAFLNGMAKVLIFLVVASVTIHHLGPIQQFLLAIIEYAGRTTRRLIALGLLLLFLLALVYLADQLIGHLIELRPLVLRFLAVITLFAFIFGFLSFIKGSRLSIFRRWNRVGGTGIVGPFEFDSPRASLISPG